MTDPAIAALESIISPDWTAQQAVAVFEMLDALKDRIWERYGNHIQHSIMEDRAYGPPSDAASINDPPF